MKQKTPYVSCIVAAAGKGSRMQSDMNKIFLEFSGIPVLGHTLTALENSKLINEIILVTSECDILGCKDIAEEFGIRKLKSITLGGALRQDSVRNALQEVSPEADIVLIHDAARPLVTEQIIKNVVEDVPYKMEERVEPEGLLDLNSGMILSPFHAVPTCAYIYLFPLVPLIFWKALQHPLFFLASWSFSLFFSYFHSDC